MKTTTIKGDIEVTKEELEAALKTFEKKKGRVEVGEKYWIIDTTGAVGWSVEDRDATDNYRYASGNYHHTKEEAEAAKKVQLALSTVRMAILDANGDWEADWGDTEQDKYTIGYNRFRSEFDVYLYASYQELRLLPEIKDDKTTRQIIKDYEKELRVILGV